MASAKAIGFLQNMTDVSFVVDQIGDNFVLKREFETTMAAITGL